MTAERLTGMAVILLLVVTACGGTPGSPQSQAPGSPGAAPTVKPIATAAPSPPAGSAATIAVEAVDSAFSVKTIEAPAHSIFKVTLNNSGEIPHDIAFYDKEGGSPLSGDAVSPLLQGGESATITFTTPGPGTYYFLCLVHPVEMNGTFVVKGG